MQAKNDWSQFTDAQKQKVYTKDAEFVRLVQRRPDVIWELGKLAAKMKDAGQTKLGFDFLYARLRWFYRFDVADDEQFDLNNDWRSHYTRTLMELSPSFKGLFENRGINRSRPWEHIVKNVFPVIKAHAKRLKDKKHNQNP